MLSSLQESTAKIVARVLRRSECDSNERTYAWQEEDIFICSAQNMCLLICD